MRVLGVREWRWLYNARVTGVFWAMHQRCGGSLHFGQAIFLEWETIVRIGMPEVWAMMELDRTWDM